ncbi:MAG: hypothetical protein JNK48_12210 [Bryobacterales bacterium]|nr:hypothetical protein [Bryobacterales bacterium]
MDRHPPFSGLSTLLGYFEKRGAEIDLRAYAAGQGAAEDAHHLAQEPALGAPLLIMSMTCRGRWLRLPQTMSDRGGKQDGISIPRP